MGRKAKLKSPHTLTCQIIHTIHVVCQFNPTLPSQQQLTLLAATGRVSMSPSQKLAQHDVSNCRQLVSCAGLKTWENRVRTEGMPVGGGRRIGFRPRERGPLLAL